MNVLVAGGTGCVGRACCRELVDRGHAVTAASRSPDPAAVPGSVDLTRLDVTEPPLDDAVAGHDVVVNLVALPSHIEPRGAGHEAVHAEGTRNLLAAGERCDVDRFVQLSALGVDSGIETDYFAAKRAAERTVRDAEFDWTIVRPSVVFGDGCAFLPFLRRLSRFGVVPLPGGGRLRLQPIWSDDLATVLADCTVDDGHAGATYAVGGPEVLSLRELVQAVRPGATVLPVPLPIASAVAAVLERVPGVPFGRDQVRVFAADNVVEESDVREVGIDPDELRPLRAFLEQDT